MNPLISIIVPVYNTEKYLDQCIQSVLAQTYTHWELLLIDDGSTDSSGVICDKYAEQDSRIKAFHKANGGASSARNLGLDNATGEWITFVDSDDWVDKSLYNEMINKADDEHSDIVVSGVYIERYDSEVQPLECSIDFKYIRSLQNFRMIEGGIYSSLCNKLFRREYINKHQLSFDPKLHMWDDLWFVLRARLYDPNISLSSNSYYHYRVDSSNSITKQSRQRKIESQLHCAELISNFISQHSEMRRYKPIGDFLKFRAKDALFDIQAYDKWLRIYPETHRFIWHYQSFYGTSRCLQYYLVAKGGKLGSFLLKSYKTIKRVCNK